MQVSAGQQLTATLRLVRPLGKGGMGTVWVAQHLARNCEVAVKLIAFDEAKKALEPEARFAREAEMAMRVRSPHIVQTFEHGTASDGQPFLVMELLEGQSLADHVDERGPLALDDVARLVDQVASALAAAHALGIVHRDIKPDNLFVETGRPSLYVKVLDFGIAKNTIENKGGALTATGLMVGSPYFMSPEQMEDTKNVSFPADIFSLGAVAYFAAVGALPFAGDTPVELWEAKKTLDFVKASRRRSELPAALDAWFERALAPKPSERFPSPQQMAIAFSDAAGMASVPAPSPTVASVTVPLVGPEAARVPAAAESEGKTSPLDLDPDGELNDAPPRTERQGPVAFAGQRQGVSTTRPDPSLGVARTAPESGPDTTAPEPTMLEPTMLEPTMLEPTMLEAPAGVASSQRFTPPPFTPPPSSVTPSIAHPPSRSVARRGAGGKLALAGLALAAVAGAATFVLTRGPHELVSRCNETEPDKCLDVATALASDDDNNGAFRYFAVAVVRDSRLSAARVELEALRSDTKFAASELTELREACDEGRTLACYLHAQMAGKPPDQHALRYLEERCEEKKDGAACAELGAVHDQGLWGVEADPKESVSYHRAACTSGQPRGCVRLGKLLLTGRGGLKRAPKLAVGHFDKACDKGEMLGCVELGRAHAGGLGELARDLDKGADLFEKACDAHALEGCWELGEAFTSGRGRKRDLTRAAKLIGEACTGGVMEACTSLGRMHELGRGGLARDVGRAIELFIEACDGGALDGCVELGIAYEVGKGTLGRDAPKAVGLYKRACQADVMSGCRVLASAFSRGIGGLEQDHFKAFDLYRRACETDDLRACVSTGYHHNLGLGGAEKNQALAKKLYERACDGGQTLGCSNLGAMYANGQGGLAKDPRRALELFILACDDGFGNATACANVGVLHANGQAGLKKDVARAAEIYRKACDQGGQIACVNLGNLYAAGTAPIERDPGRAFRIYERACNEKYARGCTQLGYAYQVGKGVTKDEKKAAALYQDACDSGDFMGCNQLAFMYEHGQGGLPRTRDRARELYRQACEGGVARACQNQRRLP